MFSSTKNYCLFYFFEAAVCEDSRLFIIVTMMTEKKKEEYIRCMAAASGFVKLVCGVANNAAWLVVLDGLDHAKQCKRYRHDVKRAFKQAIEYFHEYERTLLYARENRMFHVPDMGEKARKTYGDITDREYYDFWASLGASAYTKTRPLITSLWNKHRLSLQAHGVQDAKHVAWVLTAAAALELAVQLYEKAIDQSIEFYGLPRKILVDVFGQFSLAKMTEAWRRALNMLSPDSKFDLGSTERKNIEHGLTQLCEAWLDPSLQWKSTLQSVEDYEEVFRTKGYQKKTIDEIKSIHDKIMDNLENDTTRT